MPPALQTSTPATSPITGTLPSPPDPNARVDLPHLTCEPLLGVPEVAVLYAAGHHEAARRALEASCAEPQSDRAAWLMLLDLHRALGNQEAFDAVLGSYRMRFPGSPQPLWCMPTLPPSTNAIQLGGVLREPELAAAVAATASRRVVVFDFSEVIRIAFDVAPAFCAAFRLMALQNKRVIIANIAELHSRLLDTIGLHPGVAVLARQSGPMPVAGSNDGIALEAA